jgi:hypothetical protein
MIYTWKKLGIVWKPLKISEQTFSHSTAPTPFILSNENIRVFYTSRDSLGIGRVFYVDLDATDPRNIRGYSENPVLDVGRPGMFDDNGVMALSVIRSVNGSLYMYYIGFEIGLKIRYRLFTGLAISENDGVTFTRYQDTPILDRSEGESFFRGGPFVKFNKDHYEMYYGAGASWININDKTHPIYNLRYIESSDGLKWPTKGEVVLESNDHFHGYGRPWLLKRNGLDENLFFSARNRISGKYSIEFAKKDLNQRWIVLAGESGFQIGKESFAMHEIMYASFISINNKIYCFYNGDNFGEEGFAVAELSLD